MNLKEFQHEIKWGFILGATGLAWLLIAYLLGFSTVANQKAEYIFSTMFFLPLLGILIYGMFTKRKASGNKISYLNACKTGFIILIIGIVTKTLMSAFYFGQMNKNYGYERAQTELKILTENGVPVEEAKKSVEIHYNVKSLALNAPFGTTLSVTSFFSYGMLLVVLSAGLVKKEQ